MYYKLWQLILAAVLCAAFGMIGIAQEEGAEAGAEEKQELKYVGAGKCKMCHSNEKLAGMAHTKWSEAAHAKAFETLKTDKSKEAAAKLGIEDPSTSEQCIGCHTTPTLKPEEGVSCEACHGPAEKYLKPHGKINPAQRPPKEELVKMGMKDLTKKEDRVALCMECHKEDERNPFNKPFDYDEYWKKIDHGKKSEEEKTE